MSRARNVPWWAEAPLVVVTVVVVLGFIRVYDSWSFLAPLLTFGLVAHAAAIATRRLGAPAWATTLVAAVGAVLLATWVLFPDTASWGLPSAATWTAAGDALRVARAKYPVVVAPAEVLVGFQLAAGLAIWASVWFSDWTAHRIHATAESLASPTAIFVFCSLLGSGRDQVAFACLYAGAVLLFVAAQRAAALEREQAWLPGTTGTTSAVLRAAGAVAVVAILAGAVVGPRLPGATSEAAFPWRGAEGADDTRVTVSPLVELQKRLVEQSDTEVFQVVADRPSYWRLTSLDRFDGDIWSSSGDYRPAGEDLPSEAPAGAAARPRLVQRITIEALATIWAPAAFEATSVRSADVDLRWDAASSTLIVDDTTETSDGLSYTVVSGLPSYQRADLATDGRQDPKAIRERYLALPRDFPAEARSLARRVTAGATGRYQQALALQGHFRGYRYSLDVPGGHSDDALLAFLASREGYCEQFAGAFAAMARSLGIPARVAVGFTPGNQDPDQPNRYHVLGRHAHAWPEVYFPGQGWVPFEPTPTRGLPGAEAYTGVRAQQDEAQPVRISTTTTPPDTTAIPPSEDQPDRAPSPAERTRTQGAERNDQQDDRDGVPWWPIALAAVLVGAVVVVVRRRRRARAALPTRPAEQAWARAAAVVARRWGVAATAAETPEELVAAVRARVPRDDVGDALAELAALTTEDRWSPRGLTDEQARRADELADQLERLADEKVPV